MRNERKEFQVLHIFNTLYILYICILVKMKNDLKDRKIVPSSAVLYSEYIYSDIRDRGN